jgi:hypothetical protein
MCSNEINRWVATPSNARCDRYLLIDIIEPSEWIVFG